MEDVEDQPPEWVTVAPVTRIPEDVALFSPVSIFIIIWRSSEMTMIMMVLIRDGKATILLYLSVDHTQKTPYTKK